MEEGGSKRQGEGRAGKKERDHKRRKREGREEGEGKSQLDEELSRLSYTAYLETIKKNYTPLHPKLYHIENWKLAASLQDALKEGTPEALFAILMEAGRREEDESEKETQSRGQGVFIFEVLARDFCDLLIEEIAHFEKWCHSSGLHVKRPNTMNSYGAILDHFGFEEVLQDFIAKCVEPLSRLVFPHVHSPLSCDDSALATLDSHHAFAVEYGKSKDTKLDVHVDDSDVTVNVCLGTQFTGGELDFSGKRCELHRGSTPPLRSHGEAFRLGQRPGWGILHLGQHRHAARPILSGARTNMIIWCHSSDFRKQESSRHQLKLCPEWCGWHGMQ